jgi:CRISPR-associated protein Csy3
MPKKKSDIASVLAFEKKLVPSDGFMYGTQWKHRHESATPLKLKEKSVRGTISNRLKSALRNNEEKLNEEVEKPNLQRVDSCALAADQDTLKLSFTLKILSGVEEPAVCNHEAFAKSYKVVVENYIAEEKFTELAKRYAINLANGRFLWRNRVGVGELEVIIKQADSDKKWSFDSTAFSIKEFDYDNEDINTLAEEIRQTLCGECAYLLLEIDAFANMGKAQDVYPSEELVLDKNTNNKEKKSKILYAVNEVAAMHSQKIGNALRTIDTWYPDYLQVNTGAIAIEPYGAVTTLGKAYRTPKNKKDFYTLFDQFALGKPLATKDDEHYVMAVLVRGGVFGESGKE